MKRDQRDTIFPGINVTPLIDVLLVLLIIFMVVSPLKPSRFMAMIPQPLPRRHVPPAPDTLVVTIRSDLSLKLNGIENMGTVNDTGNVAQALARVFAQRKENRFYAEAFEKRADLADDERVQRTVFIKAPRSIHYGDVARVIDGVKGAGASPIGLQVDALE